MKQWLLVLMAVVLVSCTRPDSTTGKTVIELETPAAPDFPKEHMLGNASADIRIILYSDFECPYSKRFYEEIFPRLKQEYLHTMKASFEFRHLPLNSVHPNAHIAAVATECAALQGKFWEMHDLMFENGVSGGSAAFKTYAENLSLDMENFNRCLDNEETRQEVVDDFYSGINAGVKGTPGIILDGKILGDIREFQDLEEAINSSA